MNKIKQKNYIWLGFCSKSAAKSNVLSHVEEEKIPKTKKKKKKNTVQDIIYIVVSASHL